MAGEFEKIENMMDIWYIYGTCSMYLSNSTGLSTFLRRDRSWYSDMFDLWVRTRVLHGNKADHCEVAPELVHRLGADPLGSTGKESCGVRSF